MKLVIHQLLKENNMFYRYYKPVQAYLGLREEYNLPEYHFGFGSYQVKLSRETWHGKHLKVKKCTFRNLYRILELRYKSRIIYRIQRPYILLYRYLKYGTINKNNKGRKK